MKNMMNKATLVLGIALLAFAACKKQDVKEIAANSDMEIVAMADQATTDMDNMDVNTDPELGIALETEGIAADFLVEAEDIDDATVGSRGAGNEDNLRSAARNKSFIACLRRLDLSDRQKEAIKKALVAYAECKASAVKRARAIYADLKAKYAEKAERLIKAYRNGDISKEKFERAMKELRIAFNKELRSLHLSDKLDAAFKHCYKTYLTHLNKILTEKQWKHFVACHRR